MLKMKTCDLTALYQRMAEMGDLYLPVEVAGKTNFAAWEPDAKVDLKTLKGV